MAASSTGTMAQYVLTDSSLFRVITSFQAGWPGAFIDKWRARPAVEKESTYEARGTILRSLGRDGNQPVLRAIRDARWYDKESNELKSFEMHPNSRYSLRCLLLAGALESGDSERIQYARDQLGETDNDCMGWLWVDAIRHFDGSFTAMSALLTHFGEPPTHQYLWKKTLQTRAELAVLQWLVEQVGMKCIPREAVQTAIGTLAGARFFLPLWPDFPVSPNHFARAVKNDYLDYFAELIQYTGVTGEVERLLRRYSYLFRRNNRYLVLEIIRRVTGIKVSLGIYSEDYGTYSQTDLLKYAVRYQGYSFSTSEIYELARQGSTDIIRVVHRYDTRANVWPRVMEIAASAGHWEIVDCLHPNSTNGCRASASVLEAAARDGRIDLIERLHQDKRTASSPQVMDQAAAKGHLDIVKFLHDNRCEGCTTNAMDSAAKYGHLSVVTFLHENRSEGCTSMAIDSAAESDDIETVRFLLSNRPEGFTSAAIECAAGRGNVDLAMLLVGARPDLVSETAIRNATKREVPTEYGNCQLLKMAQERRDYGYSKHRRSKPNLQKLRKQPLFPADQRHVAILRILYDAQPSLFHADMLHHLLVCGAFELWSDLSHTLNDPYQDDVQVMRVAGERGHLATIRFLCDIRGRRDIVYHAMLGAARSHPVWISALAQLYPESFQPTAIIRDLCGEAVHDEEDDVIRLMFWISMSDDPEQARQIALDAMENKPWMTEPLISWDMSTDAPNMSKDDLLFPSPVSGMFMDPKIPDWIREDYLHHLTRSSICIDLKRNASLECEGWIRGHTHGIHDHRRLWERITFKQSDVSESKKWMYRAILNHDIDTLRHVMRLSKQSQYADDPRFRNLENARSLAVRLGQLDTLQFLMESDGNDISVEPHLRDYAIYYRRLDIARWLIVHHPEVCAEFPENHVKLWSSIPGPVGINFGLLDEIERDDMLRSRIDFGALGAYAAEEGNLGLVRRIYECDPVSFMARHDILDRCVKNGAWRSKLAVLRFLCSVGYRHVSTVAMDCMTTDAHLPILRFLHEHYRHGGRTTSAIVARFYDDSTPRLTKFHLLNRHMYGDREAIEEVMKDALQRPIRRGSKWHKHSKGVDYGSTPFRTLCEDLSYDEAFVREIDKL